MAVRVFQGPRMGKGAYINADSARQSSEIVLDNRLMRST